jgi:hypothetical protein
VGSIISNSDSLEGAASGLFAFDDAQGASLSPMLLFFAQALLCGVSLPSLASLLA